MQFVEILIYYRNYKIFPSDSIANLEVTRIHERSIGKDIIPENDILELDLAEVINTDSLGEG